MAEAMQRAIEIRPALDRLVEIPQHNSSRGPKLKQFKLTEEEWSFTVLLNKILQVRPFILIHAFVLQNLLIHCRAF